MANVQEPGFVDKHIEKIILLICLGVLAYAVMRWGLSTPRRIQVPLPTGQKEEVAPEQVDAKLESAARDVYNQVLAETAKPYTPPQYLDILARLQENPVAGPYVSMAYGIPEKGKQEESRGPDVLDPPTLAEVRQAIPVPPQPQSWAGVEVLHQEENPSAIEEKPTWHAAMVYDTDELLDRWKKNFSKTLLDVERVIAVGYDVQIQVRQPDGSWADVSGIELERTGPQVDLPAIPDYELPSKDQRSLNNKGNSLEVKNLVAQLYPEWMRYMLQPYWDDVWVGQSKADWSVHFPRELWREYKPIMDVETRRPESRTTTPTPRGSSTPTPPKTGSVPPPPPGMGPPAKEQQTPSERPAEEPLVPTQREVTSMPSLEMQLQQGKWLVWFHTRTIRYGKTYRCRMRMKLINPALAEPFSVEDAESSKVQILESPWSPWSEPISVQQNKEFFITGANESRNQMTVTVFTTCLNQRVMAKFGKIVPGMPIGGMQSVSVVNPANGQTETRTVDFNTGAVAVRFDFNREILIPAGFTRNTESMIYLDEQGRLMNRNRYYDTNADRYRELLVESGEEP